MGVPKQLASLPAEVLHLHLTSHHLVTSGPKATMAKRLYDALNPSTINNGNDASSPSKLTRNNPPLLNQQTVTNTNLPREALQAQLSSLMVQFLQYAAPTTAMKRYETPVTCLLPPRRTTLDSLCH